jgi:hypothetical protein
MCLRVASPSSTPTTLCCATIHLPGCPRDGVCAPESERCCKWSPFPEMRHRSITRTLSPTFPSQTISARNTASSRDDGVPSGVVTFAVNAKLTNKRQNCTFLLFYFLFFIGISLHFHRDTAWMTQTCRVIMCGHRTGSTYQYYSVVRGDSEQRVVCQITIQQFSGNEFHL